MGARNLRLGKAFSPPPLLRMCKSMDDPSRSLSGIKQQIIENVEALDNEIIQIARFLYENPETAYTEKQACAWLSDYLAKNGFAIEKALGGVETAFRARPQGVEPARPQLAFLAEYDALPKIGHGCGHNLIAAASAGAAVALIRSWPQAARSILLVGTPAEEGGGGKAILADAGVFQDIDAAFMFHPGRYNQLGTDSFGRIKVKIEFFGRSSHAAASPETGLNALDAIVGAYNNISALRQQLPADTRLHGIITHGGEAPNVIPDYTAGLYYVRALDRDHLKDLYQKFEDCCQAAALATGCRCQVTVQPPSLEPMKRNKTLEEVWQQNLETLGIEPDHRPSGLGSTDLGNLSQILPVIQPFLAVCPEQVSLHTTEFAQATQSQQGQDALLNAAKLLALTACDYLASGEIQRAAAAEFAGR
jgi:amidohydrolase